jgi:hypothetical protein
VRHLSSLDGNGHEKFIDSGWPRGKDDLVRLAVGPKEVENRASQFTDASFERALCIAALPMNPPSETWSKRKEQMKAVEREFTTFAFVMFFVVDP